MNLKAGLKLGLALALVLPGFAHSQVTYEYDELGRVTKVTYPGGKTVDYNYDAGDNRSSVSVSTTGTVAPPGSGSGGVIVVPLNGFTVIPLN